MGKLGAVLFLMTIALTPVAIVTFGSKQGGFFVAGYVIGIVTVPMVALGAVRAVYELIESIKIEGLVGVFIYGFLVVSISVAAAIWAIFFAVP